jgi:hypothetical protein
MKRRGVASKQTNGMTTMTNIQITKALSDAELDSVVGGTVPKAIQAMEIYHVEHEHIPWERKELLIRDIEMGRRVF